MQIGYDIFCSRHKVRKLVNDLASRVLEHSDFLQRSYSLLKSLTVLYNRSLFRTKKSHTLSLVGFKSLLLCYR